MAEISYGDSGNDVPDGKRANDAASVITDPADSQIISDCKKNIKRVRDSRLEFERQWLVNIAFLFGKQHFNLQRKPMATTEERIVWELTDLERKKKTLRQSNYILPLFRSLLSRMLTMKSTINVDAMTGAERDKSAARVGESVLQEFWQNCNKNNPMLSQEGGGMELMNKKLFTFLLAVGNGYALPYFNERTQSKAFLNGRIIPAADIGEVELKAYNPFDYFLDRGRRFVIFKEFLPVDQIYDEWNEKVNPDKADMDDIEQQLLYILQNGSGQWDDDRALVMTKYCLPSKEYKNGSYEVMTNRKVLYKGDLPAEYKGRLPGTEYKFLDFMFGPYGQGMIEQLVNLQEEYNFTLSRMAQVKKWMTGKILVPRGAKLSYKWNDEQGQILFYQPGSKPEYQQAGSPPEFYFKDLMRIRKDMEDIASIHDASMGREPDQAKSGIAIENLSELDNSQLAPDLMSVEQKHEYVCEQILDIMEAKYSVRRFMGLTSENLPGDVQSFIGSDLVGNKRIKVSMGSNLPASKSARQNFLAQNLEAGIISKEEARKLSEFGDIPGIYTNLDEQAAKEENQIMLKDGYEVIVEPWEDHTVHLNTHHKFMKTPQFFQLPDPQRQKYIDHCAEHQAYLSQEALAASPPPPPPMPMPGPGPMPLKPMGVM